MIDIQGTPVQIDSGCVQMGAYPFVYEDMYEPRLARLREEEALDSVVADAKDDVDAMAKLRHYVRTLWPHTHPDPPPPADALEMLHLIRKGKTGGFCGNFTTVFTPCCAALPTRRVRAGHLTTSPCCPETNCISASTTGVTREATSLGRTLR